MGQGDQVRRHQARVTSAIPAKYSVTPVELSRCRGIGDRCKVGRSAGMITVRRDAVRRKAMHRGAEEINETTKQWVRHRGLKLVFDHAEVVKCDISATANTLESQDTPNLLFPISNIRAVRSSCTREHR